MRFLGFVARLGVVVVIMAIVPSWWCGREAGLYYSGERETQIALARQVSRSVLSGVTTSNFSTGSARFDGEWNVGTHQMAVLGLGQVILEHPEMRDELMPAIDVALETLRAPETHRFGIAAWGENGVEALGSAKGHAYLGYVNLAFGMDRMLRPDSPHAEFHDRLTSALARRLEASSTGTIQTYPSESYPPDVSSVAGSIGLHGRVTGADHSALLRRWSKAFREHAVDGDSGLLVQCVHSKTGEPLDRPRASGTAIGAYFLSFADDELSRELFNALQRNRASFLGFGGIREYPSTIAGGLGDIDSGPVFLGVGVSATGFSIASARIHGDRDLFASLFRTATLFGAPVNRGNGRWFVTGGPLGNAIMLAMLTAGPGATPEGGAQ